jgi:hypothetical protein
MFGTLAFALHFEGARALCHVVHLCEISLQVFFRLGRCRWPSPRRCAKRLLGKIQMMLMRFIGVF